MSPPAEEPPAQSEDEAEDTAETSTQSLAAAKDVPSIPEPAVTPIVQTQPEEAPEPQVVEAIAAPAEGNPDSEEVEADVAASEDVDGPPAADGAAEPAEVDPDAIPVIPGEWTNAERFKAFRSWLEAGGPRYEVWAKDCIFIEARPPVLLLEFPPGFRATHVSATNRDARLLKGVAAFFDGCKSVQVRNRAEDSDRMTHRESVAHEAAVAQQALEQQIADDADIATIAAHFDAAIRSVHKDFRSPTPPVLAPEEVH